MEWNYKTKVLTTFRTNISSMLIIVFDDNVRALGLIIICIISGMQGWGAAHNAKPINSGRRCKQSHHRELLIIT